jgi:tetratricopeptide (TPR) repeat protein
MPKIARNAPCPCGSGKKYKRCCLKKIEDQQAAARRAAATAKPPDWAMEEDDLDELSNSAVDLIKLGKLDEAEAVGHQLLKRYPEIPDGLERLAAVHEARGDFAKAARYYRQAAELIEGQDGYDPEIGQFFKEKAAKLQQKT